MGKGKKKISAEDPRYNNDRVDLGLPQDVQSYIYMDRPYDPSQDRERTRANIALILVWTLSGVIAFCLAVFAVKVLFLMCGASCGMQENTLTSLVTGLTDILELVFGPLIALIGAVIGFYFGEKAAAK